MASVDITQITGQEANAKPAMMRARSNLSAERGKYRMVRRSLCTT
jgi:hypothetical protein